MSIAYKLFDPKNSVVDFLLDLLHRFVRNACEVCKEAPNLGWAPFGSASVVTLG
jgi:hypothetical protein